MPKKKQTVVDVGDFLAQNLSAPKPKGKKGGIPELTECKDLADRTYHAYKAKKDAEAAFKAIEAQVLDITNKEYEARGQTNEFTKSLNLPGQSTPGCQVSYKDVFEALPLEQKADLQVRLGDKFDAFFEEKRTVTLAETDDDTIKVVLAKLGPELFKKVFTIQVQIVTKPDMDKRQWELPEELRPKQAKASLKIQKGDAVPTTPEPEAPLNEKDEKVQAARYAAMKEYGSKAKK